MMRCIVILCFVVLCAFPASAQMAIRGVVTDSVSNEPLEMATVTYLRNSKPILFARTDAQGRFTLSVKGIQNGDKLSASYLGYAKAAVTLDNRRSVSFRLRPENFTLKEVTIKAGRIYGKQDTISYDLSLFAGNRDNNLKDVLRKLPGVDVDKDGTISYNGKAINRFTVEGLDLTGGRYNLINENLKAKDVATAEIIEHDQPIKALQKKITTDDVAMNVKLKPEARDKWIFTLSPLLKVGTPVDNLDVGGHLSALQIGKKQQSLYGVEADRTGRDLSLSNKQLTSDTGTSLEPDTGLPQCYDTPALAAPIDAERLRFNTSQSWNVNKTFKTKDEKEIKWMAGYMHSSTRQSTTNCSRYYLNTDKQTETTQSKDFRLLEDRLSLNLNSEINTDKSYGSESFLFEASQSDGQSDYQKANDSFLHERIKIPLINISNQFYKLMTYEHYTLSVRSLLRFAHSPSSLNVDGDRDKQTTNGWYTDNSLTWLSKLGFFTQSYSVGVNAEDVSLHGSNQFFSCYFSPYWEYKRSSLTARIGGMMQWKRYPRQGNSFFDTCPWLSLNMKSGYHHEYSFYAQYRESAGDWMSFLLPAYRKDYRTMFTSDGVVPRTKILFAKLEHTYKRPLNEFFWNSSASFQQIGQNVMTDMQINDGQYLYHMTQQNNHSQIKQISSILSKGFFNLHLKTKLAAKYCLTDAVQSSEGTLLNYQNSQVIVEPQLIYSPSWAEVDYSGTFAWTKSRVKQVSSLATLFDWSQRLMLTRTIGAVDISVSAVHYHNELQLSGAANMLLVDASLVWRTRKVRFEVNARNLFNKQRYERTTYSGVSSLTDSYMLRPREILFNMQFTL